MKHSGLSDRAIHAAMFAGLCAAVPAGAAPVMLEVDSSLSSVQVSVSIAGGILSDEDTSPISGFVRLELDGVSAPGVAGLHAFRLVVDDDLHLQDSAFLVGGFEALITDAVFLFAPPPPDPATVGAGGSVTFQQVNSESQGEVTYTVTGNACNLLGGASCNDTIDLSDAGVSQLDSFAGELTVSGGIVTLAASVSMTMPIDPDNPSVGTLTVDADLVARGVACPADITGSASPGSPGYLQPNGVVDADDFFAFLALFAAGDARADISGSASPGSQAYLVPDGVIDADDFFTFLSVFAAGCS